MSEEKTLEMKLPRRTLLRGAALGAVGAAGVALVGCGDDDDDDDDDGDSSDDPTATTASESPTEGSTDEDPTEAASPEPTAVTKVGAELFVLSQSSPHVTVINLDDNTIARTADIEGFTSWTWNDDRNWATETELWVGMKDADTNDVEVVTLDFETLTLTNRIPIGQDDLTLYIGQADSTGRLHVAKMGSGQVAVIDTATYTLEDTWDVPVNGGVACDADISVDENGVERFAYPTRNGDTVVTLDPTNGAVLNEIATPSGSTPLMLSAGPKGHIWVQDTGSRTNTVYAPADLTELARFPTGSNPIVASFSIDGSMAFIGHGDDTFVQVVDTETFEEVTRVVAGTSPQKLGVHPDGSHIYAILTQEAAVAIIDTETWEVSDRVEIGTNPTGIFARSLA